MRWLSFKERPDVQREDIWIDEILPAHGASPSRGREGFRDQLSSSVCVRGLYLHPRGRTRASASSSTALWRRSGRRGAPPIGVSNYGHTAELLAVCTVPPCVNQVRGSASGASTPSTRRVSGRVNPSSHARAPFSASKSILVEAYPARAGQDVPGPALARRRATVSTLTPASDDSLVPSARLYCDPKSVTPARIEENAQLGDAPLSAADARFQDALTKPPRHHGTYAVAPHHCEFTKRPPLLEERARARAPRRPPQLGADAAPRRASAGRPERGCMHGAHPVA